MLIDNTAALLVQLQSCRMKLHWLIPPDAPPSVLLSPRYVQLFVGSAPVENCQLIEEFTQFLCDSIGEIEHTLGTTNTATASLKLTICGFDRMIDIDYECAESPAVEGSCYFESGFISVSLPDFLEVKES